MYIGCKASNFRLSFCFYWNLLSSHIDFTKLLSQLGSFSFAVLSLKIEGSFWFWHSFYLWILICFLGFLTCTGQVSNFAVTVLFCFVFCSQVDWIGLLCILIDCLRVFVCVVCFGICLLNLELDKQFGIWDVLANWRSKFWRILISHAKWVCVFCIEFWFLWL